MRKKGVLRRKVLFPLLLLILASSSVIALFPSFLGTPPNGNNQTDHWKIVGKQIPAGYVMGNPVDAGLMNGMTVLFIRNPAEKVSIRFTAQLSGTATKLSIYAFATAGQPTVRFGLQEDEVGKPKGEWIGGKAYGTAQLPSSSWFITVKLQATAAISKGRVYHIVVEAAENPLNGTAAVKTFLANSFAQPLNVEDPDIIWNDTKMNSLSYNGQVWREEDKWPIFIVEYSDGKLEGQTYSLSAQWVVYASTYVGQTLIPASDYMVGKIAFVVGLQGTPKDKLYYEVRDSDNKTMAEGLFAEANQLTSPRTWIEVTIPTPVTLKAGRLYRIFLLSPGTDLANCYYLFGDEFSYNNTIGYGGLQHQLTSSHNSGNNWSENPDADAIFKITATG